MLSRLFYYIFKFIRKYKYIIKDLVIKKIYMIFMFLIFCIISYMEYKYKIYKFRFRILSLLFMW